MLGNDPSVADCNVGGLLDAKLALDERLLEDTDSVVLCCGSEEVTADIVDRNVDPVARTVPVTCVLARVVAVCWTTEVVVLCKVSILVLLADTARSVLIDWVLKTVVLPVLIDMRVISLRDTVER